MGRLSGRKKKGRERKIKLTEEQAQEFMRIVRDDLVFLRSLDYRRPSRTDVRIASSILRRLLYEGMYQGAWALVGLEGQPSVSAVDLQAVVAELQPQHIQYAYAGGAKTDGAHHKGYVLLAVPRAEAEAEGYDAAARRIRKLINIGATREFSLSEFLKSPAVISGKAAVSRLDVVRFVANKLGGVHWDNKRGKWTDPVGSRHRLLDEEHLMIGRLPAPLYEALSIAQAIASCNDTVRFIERVAAVAPEQERRLDVISFREGRIGKYADITFGEKASGKTHASIRFLAETTLTEGQIMRIDAVKFGVAFGIVYGVTFFMYGAVAALFEWGVEFAALIGDFYLGFGPTLPGALIGAVWGFAIGFVFFALAAWIYNALTGRTEADR